MGKTSEAHDHDDHEDHGHEEDDHDHDHDHGPDRSDHVKLTQQAFENLGLKMQPLQRTDYWNSRLVPAEIVEIPGRSNLSVSAPLSGVIQEVQVLPGEAIGEGTPICRLTITDEALVQAQSSLLENLSQIDVTQSEINRLTPLTKSGAVAGKALVDENYRLQKLAATKDTLIQELQGRGLPDALVKQLIDKRQLVTSLQVSSFSFAKDELLQSDAEMEDRRGYSIEALNIHPGKTVRRGDDLCHLSYHEQLYIQGTAFESDLPILDQIADQNWSIAVDFENHPVGDEHHSADSSLMLNLLRVDNHVDDVTQTVRFFISLPNEVQRTVQGDGGKVFQQWKYRPGQRVHLNLPTEQWENQFVVPAQAVALDGPNATIFAKYKVPFHLKSEEDYDMFMEMEPIPVRLLHRDSRRAVIEPESSFSTRRPVAMNHAHKLQLAVKMQSGGAADPHAGHSH